MMEQKISNFGVFIKRHRKIKGLSQDDLADKLDIERAHLSRIECGRKKFRVEKLERLAQALGIELAELKKEFYSDFFAEQIFENECPVGVLEITRQKVAGIISRKMVIGVNNS
jgi:transcriptional regulator with XRE-family HTH domain